MTALDFPAFYRAVHGHDPFPWQADMVSRVMSEGRWPDLVDVPTGLGKTSMLDVAVFVAAATAGTPGACRIGRRRCFFVVDRRIVVDEAYAHALHLQHQVERAARQRDSGVLGAVVAGLRAYAPDAASGELLPVTRMRGGATWSAAWLDRPDRPGLVLGTVDQVGSRLLFRGYGVTDRRRPIDAALVGIDALLLVDEAHLSTALLTTVNAAQQRDRLGLPLPGLSVVRLSATGAPSEHVFTLDVDAHRPNPEAWRRLTAGKTLQTMEVPAKDCSRALVAAVLDQLTALSSQTSPGGYAPVGAVVCNTVDRARAVHALLTKQVTALGAAVRVDCELLIGRARPVDRPGLQERVLERFGTGREPAGRAAVLVATQTVEVGVNLDVDVLVTESASWDALVQRLGRLNRLGWHSERFPHRGAAAIVVHDGQEDGPVYGRARDATWQVLTALVGPAGGGADVSPLACRALTLGLLGGERYVRAPGGVPVLLRPTLDAWVQTGPVPLTDPPIEPFLHGFDNGVAAVQVIWRDGLTSDDALDDPFEDDGAELAAAEVDTLLTLMPPRTAETAEVPFVAVRQWLSGQTPDPVSDVDAGPEADGRARLVREPFRALARRPGGQARRRQDSDLEPETPLAWCWIEAGQLRPGDQIVVPTRRGGLDVYGWSPADQTPVRDASEQATFTPGRSLRPGVLRLDRGLPARLALPAPAANAVAELMGRPAGDDATDRPLRERLHDFGSALAAGLPEEPDPASGWDRESWRRLRRWAGSDRLRLVRVQEETEGRFAGDAEQTLPWGSLLVGPVPADRADEFARSPEPVPELLEMPDRDDEEVAASSVGATRVTLAVHHAAVRERAGQIAVALGLPAELCAVIEDAARWHDLGKVEDRFQIMLHGGDACEAALALEPLAKSGLDPADRLSWRRASRLSRLPGGARHEAWSVALVEEHVRARGVPYPGDEDLLLHLVASHHGYARPFARLVVDPRPRIVEAVVDGEKVSVSSDRTVSLEHPARFARLNQRYGRWGLALLETIVRCADMTVSEEGS